MDRYWTGKSGGPDLKKGQDLAEYALLISAIAIVVLAAISLLGIQIRDIFSLVGAGFSF